MKKRTQLIVLSVLIFVVIFVVLSSSIFSFSALSVDYLTTNIKTNLTSDLALQNSGLNYGKSIFFLDKNSAAKNIEKQNPYLKVVNIETVFPNELIVHVSERQELFSINYNNKYLILDDEGKILSIETTFINSAQSAILLENYNINNTASQSQNEMASQNAEIEYQEGDFIANNNNLKEIAKVLKEWKLSFAELKAHIISILSENDNLILNMRCGLTIEIFHSSVNLSDKINLAFSIYDKAEDIENKTSLEIRSVKNEMGEYELKGYLS